MSTTTEKRRAFRNLHRSGCFVIPNPWNVGSALYLQSLGFPALASTSSGYAYSLGRPDSALSRDQVLAHYCELAAATDIPLNADFENGYAHEPDALADNVRLCVDTGVAGLSIEDFTGDETAPLYDFDKAVVRVRAARQAIDQSGGDVLLTARAEGFLHGRPDLDDAIRRLTAFAEAGADCLYVPGIKTREQIEAVVTAVAPKPVNLLMSAAGSFTVSDIAAMGVRRISVGGALARVAMDAFIKAATLIATEGRFDRLGGVISGTDLDAFFAQNTPSEQ
ncbi:oxaloacetate decarboxylase [Pseudolabrys sp. FHR47]|uniref:isocitrate lyase/PEP mutase family protein n=1 Tax=Pseudolabrys sp. FHR47 TaxID=2562284 RepID=UPI0010BF4FD7|nr:isocitrate lyase/phosphoenolpyruvate mutase family protein [Pseudolabrys sp. FHR47]